MQKFKAGDKVRVAQPEGESRSGIENGEVHTVARVAGDGWIALAGVKRPGDICDDTFPADIFEPAPAQQASAVHRPHHYARYKIEPVHFIHENNLPFMVGNVVKYVLRYDAKDGLQDLKKAKRYLEMLIASEEGRDDWSS